MKKIYSHYVEPERYPVYKKRTCRVVTHDVLDNKIQFSSARFFPMDYETNKIINIDETIKKYTEDYNIGKCFWLNWKNFVMDNFDELVKKLGEKNLYLYGAWGYVMGVRAVLGEINWGEFHLSTEQHAMMTAHLGEHFLGYEMGEQDGRYIGAYTSREDNTARPKSHVEQSKAFSEFFLKVADNFYNRMTILCSLPMPHYYARDGYASLLSCETAQHLPNSQMWYAFLRGASKQYGILCSGNVSIWGNHSYKTYESTGEKLSPSGEVQYAWGPTKGTSLSLLRRIMYNEYMYNCDILGFEQSWFSDENEENDILGVSSSDENVKKYGVLSPVGRLQQYANNFVSEYGKPGAMYTPFAIIQSPFAGWLTPRSPYTRHIYQVWGNIPYGSGDYQTHAIFDMLYPGYENAGYFANEYGFLSATPYGEITDVLLSDAAFEIINRYCTVFVTDGTLLDAELFDKLSRFALSGGEIILTASVIGGATDTLKLLGRGFYSVFGLDESLKPDNTATVKYESDGSPLIIEKCYGNGVFTVILVGNGTELSGEAPSMANIKDSEISKPYKMSGFMKNLLAEKLDGLALVRPDNRKLQYIVTVKNSGTLLIQVTNNSYKSERFNLVSASAEIADITEISIDDNLYSCEGYYAEAAEYDVSPCTDDGTYEIAAGDFRIFEVKLTAQLKLAEESYPLERSIKTAVRMPGQATSIKDYIMTSPSFTQYFDGLLVNASYFEGISAEKAKTEAAYLNRLGITVSVDFLPMFNLFPGLSFNSQFPVRCDESYRRLNLIFENLSYYKCDSVLISLIRRDESNSPYENYIRGLKEAYEYIRSRADGIGAVMLFQNRPVGMGTEDAYKNFGQINGIGKVLNVSSALCRENTEYCLKLCTDNNITALMLCSPLKDEYGQLYNSAVPVSGSDFEDINIRLAEKMSDAEGVRLFFAANYSSWDEIYADYCLIMGG